MKVIETLWFTNNQGTIGIVCVEEDITNDRKAYIGIGKGENEQEDKDAILAWGNKFTLSTAEHLVLRLTKPVTGSISS